MSNNFNVSDIAKLAQGLLSKYDKGREFMLEDIHRLTREAYEQYPQDTVITQVSAAIERLAEKAPKGQTISQAEISTIYNNFAKISSDSRFREVLGGLLVDDGFVSTATNASFINQNRVDADIEKSLVIDYDKSMTDTIASVFSGSGATMAFDNKIATRGIDYVAAELASLGLKPSVEIAGGNKELMIYAANFDTRKGRITVAIPTQISNGRVLFPSIFVADDHLEELTANALNSFIEKKALSGNFSVPKTADVLSAISVVLGQRNANEQEFSKASNSIPSIKEKEMDPLHMVANKLEDVMTNLNSSEISMESISLSSQKVAMPKELAHLARDFEDDVLEAASSFGLEAIRQGKELVASELRTAGFRNAQVKFGSESNKSVVYLASINTPKGTTEIEVATEMRLVAENKYMPLMPTYFAFDGLVEDFTPAKLQRFAISLPAPSSKTTIYSTAFSYMLLPELKDEILKAASENDYITCEFALSEVKERFKEEDYKNAISDYHFILTQKAKLNKKTQYKCAKLIYAGHGSVSDRCGHYLCALDKVITDENGNCRLKTAIERERLNPAEEGGACISTSKINLT